MPINFPSSPSYGQLYTFNNITWQWLNEFWVIYTGGTGTIVSAYTAGNGISIISAITNNNIVLKALSGTNINIIDTGNGILFSGNTGGSSISNAATGGTYSNGIITLSGTGILGQITGLYTGGTDVYSTGGTYTAGTITITNNTGGTFNISGLYTGGTDVYVTGGTYLAGTLTLVNNTGGTFTISGFPVTGGTGTDTYITGGTYSNGTLTLTNNYNNSISVNGFTTSTLYTGDGTLLSNRNVNLSGYSLNFSSTTQSNVFNITNGLVGFGKISNGATVDVNGIINIPTTTASTYGLITQNNTRLLHTIGTNTYLGLSAGTFNGALLHYDNVGIGLNALRNNGFSDNVAVGSNAMSANTSGLNNVAVGSKALNKNINGYSNVGIGAFTLLNNTTGHSNVTLGALTLVANSLGNYNIAIGEEAGGQMSSGEYNTAIGYQTLYTGNGSRNIGIGTRALISVLSGNNNIAIGEYAGSQPFLLGNNNILIGTGAGSGLTLDNKLIITNGLYDALLYGDFATRRIGLNTITPTHAFHVSATTNPVRFEGLTSGSGSYSMYLVTDNTGVVYYKDNPFPSVVVTDVVETNPNEITVSKSDSTTNTFTIDAATGGHFDNGIVTLSGTGIVNIIDGFPSFNTEVNLRTIELGSRFFSTNFDYTLLVDNLVKILNTNASKGVLFNTTGSLPENYVGTDITYYTTFINPSTNERQKIKWVKQTIGVDYNASIAFTTILDTIKTIYDNIYINFYCELTLKLDVGYYRPTQVRLANPLFNSYSTTNHSKNKHYLAKTQFIKDPYSHTLISDFFGGYINYYDVSTSNDITRVIYDIVLDNRLYGVNSNIALTAMYPYQTFDNDIREVTMKTLYVESIGRFNNKHNIPVNANSFFTECSLRYNNFYGTLLIDNVGGSPTTIYSNASSTNLKSSAFAHFIDIYRLSYSGNPYVIYPNQGYNDTKLNDLTYHIYERDNNVFGNLKYIGKNRTKPYMQLLPGYQNIYILKLSVTGNYGTDDAGQQFLTYLINNFLTPNDISLPKTSSYWSSLVSTFKTYLIDDTTFNSNPYGPYIIIQSNDDLISNLSTGNTFTYGPITFTIDSVYKGYSFKPMLYPLNMNQLMLEVPESLIFDGVNIIPSNYSANNTFNVDGVGNISNKQLRLIIKYKDFTEMDLITKGLSYTIQRGSHDTNMVTLILDNNVNLETLIVGSISNRKRKYLRPNNVEISLAFFDTLTNKTSLIPNYKIIIDKYGDNEIFKLIRSGDELNSLKP